MALPSGVSSKMIGARSESTSDFCQLCPSLIPGTAGKEKLVKEYLICTEFLILLYEGEGGGSKSGITNFSLNSMVLAASYKDRTHIRFRLFYQFHFTWQMHFVFVASERTPLPSPIQISANVTGTSNYSK